MYWLTRYDGWANVVESIETTVVSPFDRHLRLPRQSLYGSCSSIDGGVRCAHGDFLRWSHWDYVSYFSTRGCWRAMRQSTWTAAEVRLTSSAMNEWNHYHHRPHRHRHDRPSSVEKWHNFVYYPHRDRCHLPRRPHPQWNAPDMGSGFYPSNVCYSMVGPIIFVPSYRCHHHSHEAASRGCHWVRECPTDWYYARKCMWNCVSES